MALSHNSVETKSIVLVTLCLARFQWHYLNVYLEKIRHCLVNLPTGPLKEAQLTSDGKCCTGLIFIELTCILFFVI